MRLDSSFFNTDNILGSKDPRYVIGIDFDGSIQYLTSHDDIANVPGSPIQNCIQGISATSQTLNPDRANATIGSMTFDIVDLASAFTDKVRTELDTNDVGLRGRTVTFHMGYVSLTGAGILDGGSTGDNPDFDNFALFQTQIIQSVQTKEGRYSISCADIQRETKKVIFDLALTYLTTSIDAATTTIPVLDLSGFEGNNHGTSYTDAPSANVIYIRLDSTKEIIRCPVSGISGNDFTGVTRGVLGTDAKAVEVDVSKPSDRRPKVEEFVYLELPAVKLAYAILTGDIEGTANVLPTSWHAGVPTNFVRLSDFQNIGDDLWDTTDDELGVVVRFEGLNKQDAKSFLETELYLLLGLFSPVYSDGQLGLKRMVPSLPDSPYIFNVDDSNTISTSNLTHDMESIQNNLRIDWNWNGERFIRSTIIVDSASIARHGKGRERRLGFRGLAGTRFTEQVLRQLLTSLRDMYTGPPLRLPVSGFHLMNQIEVGDPCRVTLSNIRDYTKPGASLDRTMVVHGMSVDWLAGVKLKLFGSSERADEIPPVEAAQCLLDAFYSQEGTALSSIGGLMSGNVTNAGTFTLVGSADMNATASIFYHDAPLTISSATTLNIEGNVQLRVRGFLTIDGTIDGTGNGHVTDTNNFVLDDGYDLFARQQVGNTGFIGNSMSHHGLRIVETQLPNWVGVTAAYFTPGLYDAFPNLILDVTDSGSGAITGIPTDMRGTGGSYGPRAGSQVTVAGITLQKATGGAGGSGGSALCIVCRGGDFGAGGEIILDGDPSLEPTTFYSVNGYEIYGGAGGAGSPGALLWLIDGSSQTFPDLAGHFQAKTGNVPAQFALPLLSGLNQSRNLDDVNAPVKNMAPFIPLDRISDYDQSGVNFRISFLPCEVPPEEDQADIVPPPTNLVAVEANSGVQLNWTNPEGDGLVVDVHRSDRNIRSTAVVIATTASGAWLDNTANVERGARYYWVQARNADGVVSLFEPDTSAGVFGRPLEDRTNWVVDPEFNIGNPADNWQGNGNGSQTEFWRANMFPNDGTATADHQPTAGEDGGVAIDFRCFGGATSATGQIQSKKFTRFQTNKSIFQFVIKYRTEGSVDALDHINFRTTIRTAETEFGGAVSGSGGTLVTLPRSAAYTTVTLQQKVNAVGFNFIGWEIAFLDSEFNTHDALRIDSIFVYQVGGDEFGDNVQATEVQAGLVPSALAAESGLFLKGDGSWGTPTGSGVDSFNSRTGVVVPLIADYDSFFLTPAEGDAAYSLLAHTHSAFDRASSVLSGANVFSDIVVTDGIVTAIATRALTFGNVSNFATPLNNQLAIWTDAQTIEGSPELTWDGTGLTIDEAGVGAFAGLKLTGGVTGGVGIMMLQVGGATDTNRWNIDVSGGAMTMRPVSDAISNGAAFFFAQRDGNAVDELHLITTVEINLDTPVVILTGNITATNFNAVPLTAAGAATNFLNEAGAYSVPVGGADLSANEVITGSWTVDGDSFAFNDDKILNFGSGNDFGIRFSSGANEVVNQGIGTTNWSVILAATDTMILVTANAGVALSYNGAQKFVTLTGGISVTGDVGATTFNDVAITDAGAATNYLDESGSYSVPVGSGFTPPLVLLDNDQIQFGTSNDARMFFDASDLRLQLTGAANQFIIQLNGTELSAVFNPNGSVDLYYNNAVAFRTNATGAEVLSATDNNPQLDFYQDDGSTLNADILAHSTGGISITGRVHGAFMTLQSEDSGGVPRVFLQADPDAVTTIRGDTALDLQVGASGETGILITANAEVGLYFNDLEKLRTETGGILVTGDVTSGRIRLTVTSDASLSSTLHAFQIGATASANIIMDGNELIARSAGAAATLNINITGGAVHFGTSGANRIALLNGAINAAQFIASGNITANGNIVGDGATVISGIETITIDATGDITKASHGNYLYHQSTIYNDDQEGGITFATGNPTGGADGDIWFKYDP